MAAISFKTARILLLVFNVVLFGITLAVNRQAIKSGLFNTTTSPDRQHYDLDIIPEPWTFGVIWSTVYLMAIALITYSIVNIFRSTPTGKLYYSPDIITVPFLIFYMFNWIFNSGWIYVAEAGMYSTCFLPAMAIILWHIFIVLAMSLVFSYKALRQATPALIKFGMSADIWAVRVIVQNGVSVYATWAAIASSINVGLALAFYFKVDHEVAGTVALGIVSALVVLYVTLDFAILDRWTRYVFAPHCTLVVAMSGSLARIGISHAQNSIFVLVLLSVSVAALVAKIVVTAIRASITSSFQLEPIMKTSPVILESPIMSEKPLQP